MPGAVITALAALAALTFAAAPAAMMVMMVMVMFAMAPFAIATLIPAPLLVLAAPTTFAVMPGMRRAIGATRSAAARGHVRRTLRPGSGRHAGHGQSQYQSVQSV